MHRSFPKYISNHKAISVQLKHMDGRLYPLHLYISLWYKIFYTYNHVVCICECPGMSCVMWRHIPCDFLGYFIYRAHQKTVEVLLNFDSLSVCVEWLTAFNSEYYVFESQTCALKVRESLSLWSTNPLHVTFDPSTPVDNRQPCIISEVLQC